MTQNLGQRWVRVGHLGHLDFSPKLTGFQTRVRSYSMPYNGLKLHILMSIWRGYSLKSSEGEEIV